RGEQLRPRGGDHERAAALDRELDVVIGGGPLAVLELGLRHGALEVDVPHRRRVAALHLALREQVEKGMLRGAARGRVDRPVFLAPVAREPEPFVKSLERALVLARDAFARLDEVRARDLARRLLAVLRTRLAELEAGLVRHARVAADVEVVL